MSLEIISIDDSDDDVFVLQRALKKAKVAHVLIHFDLGTKAIAHFARWNNSQHRLPSVILLDMNMPDLTGLEILNWLKTNPKTAHIPVIVNTHSVFEQDKKNTLSLGAAAFVSKTFDYAEIIQRIKDLAPSERQESTKLGKD